jgi:hypothetical protein
MQTIGPLRTAFCVAVGILGLCFGLQIASAQSRDAHGSAVAIAGRAADEAARVFSRPATYLINGLAASLLAAFIPISAISFHRFRLPRKEQGYTKVVRALNLEPEAATLSMPALKSEYSGMDYCSRLDCRRSLPDWVR